MKKIKTLLFTALLTTLILMISSCATTLNVRVQRPSELDMNNAKSIAILPFQTSGWSMPGKNGVVRILDFFFGSYGYGEDARCADYLTRSISQNLYNGNFYRLIDPYVVQDQIRNGETPSADVYLSGRVNYLEDRIEKETRKKTKNEKTIYYDVYIRKVNISVSYMVINAKNNCIIDMKNAEYSEWSSAREHIDELPTALDLLRYDLQGLAERIGRQVQPYYVTKSIELLEDSSKNPDMKTADELAKNGLYEQAYNKFYDIYLSTGYFEAGYNASMIMLATGDYQKAKSIMSELVDRYGTKKAIRALSDINNEILSAKRLEEQLNN